MDLTPTSEQKMLRDAAHKYLRAEYAFKQASRADKLQWCASGLEGFVARKRRYGQQNS